MEIYNWSEDNCACPLYPIQMFVYHVLSFVGGKSKTDGSAERRHALDKETMGAIFGKSRLAVCLKCLSRFVFEFTLQPLKKYIVYE